MRLILANCAVENGNRGCVALSLSTMFILKGILESKGIPYKFYLPNSGHEEFGEYVLHSGNLEIKYTAIPDISCHDKLGLLRAIFRYKRTIKTWRIYKAADAVLDIGVGDSFADIYGKPRFNSIFGQYRLGMRFGLPYCILPQTIGPYSDTKIRKRAIKGIRFAKCVMTRDKKSFDYLKEIFPEKDVTECIDVAFFMPFEHQTFEPGFIHVGLNISALLWHGGYTRNNQFGLKCDYQSLVRSIIDYFLSLKGVKLHLVPHVVGGERHVENDYAVSYDLWREYKNEHLVLSPLFLDPIIAKSYISGLDFFMGARMHATIAAFSTCVPVVPMAYSRKFNGLFIDTLSYGDLVDMKTFTNEDALQTIKDCFARRDKEKELIKEQMETTVKERGELIRTELMKFLRL